MLELRSAKREQEEASSRLAKLSVGYKEIRHENKEMRKILQANEGYKKLEETVLALTSMLVSKRNEHLST